MNKVILTGRITKDLELRSTNNNTSVCEFTIATNRPVTRDGERQADFITCVVFGIQAENLKKYQGKGSLIAVFGEMRVDQWKTEQGENRYKTYVLVNNVEFLNTKPSENVSNAPAEKTDTEAANNDPYADFGQQMQINESDLPF